MTSKILQCLLFIVDHSHKLFRKYRRLMGRRALPHNAGVIVNVILSVR
jgi:hypothetical protein